MFRPVYSEYASRFSSAVMKKKKKYIHFGSTLLIAQLIFLLAHLKMIGINQSVGALLISNIIR